MPIPPGVFASPAGNVAQLGSNPVALKLMYVASVDEATGMFTIGYADSVAAAGAAGAVQASDGAGVFVNSGVTAVAGVVNAASIGNSAGAFYVDGLTNITGRINGATKLSIDNTNAYLYGSTTWIRAGASAVTVSGRVDALGAVRLGTATGPQFQRVNDSSVSLTTSDGTNLGTLQAATVTNPSGTLTLGDALQSVNVVSNFSIAAARSLTHNGTVADLGGLSVSVRDANLKVWNSAVIGWSSSGVSSGTLDTGLSRISAGVVGVGNGTAGNASGTLRAATLLSSSSSLYLGDTGVNRWQISANLMPAGTNIYDLGHSAATVRNGYFGTKVVTPTLQDATAVKVTTDGTTLGTLQAGTIDNPSAALTLGNATHGVSVPGAIKLFNGSNFLSSTHASLVTMNGGGFTTVGMPLGRLHIGGTSQPVKELGVTGGIVASGNVLIGTTTDDGVSKLQVNGAATFSGTISSTGGQTHSERFGDSSSVSGTNALAVGKLSRAALWAVAVGYDADANTGNSATSVGMQAQCTSGKVALGFQAKATGLLGTALGFATFADTSYGIALGSKANTTAANQLMVGGATAPINNVVFHSDAAAVTIGTDSATHLTLNNTGAATFSGDVVSTGVVRGSTVIGDSFYFTGYAGQIALFGTTCQSRNDGGFASRNYANSADAPITAGAITASGTVAGVTALYLQSKVGASEPTIELQSFASTFRRWRLYNGENGETIYSGRSNEGKQNSIRMGNLSTDHFILNTSTGAATFSGPIYTGSGWYQFVDGSSQFYLNNTVLGNRIRVSGGGGGPSETLTVYPSNGAVHSAILFTNPGFGVPDWHIRAGDTFRVQKSGSNVFTIDGSNNATFGGTVTATGFSSNGAGAAYGPEAFGANSFAGAYSTSLGFGARSESNGVAIGYAAGTPTGIRNINIGYSAGGWSTTSYNVHIGVVAGESSTYSGSIALGNYSTPTANNQFAIGSNALADVCKISNVRINGNGGNVTLGTDSATHMTLETSGQSTFGGAVQATKIGIGSIHGSHNFYVASGSMLLNSGVNLFTSSQIGPSPGGALRINFADTSKVIFELGSAGTDMSWFDTSGNLTVTNDLYWNGTNSQRLNGGAWESYESSLTAWQAGTRQQASASGVMEGFFGASPVLQPAAPTTLAGLHVAIRSVGLVSSVATEFDAAAVRGELGVTSYLTVTETATDATYRYYGGVDTNLDWKINRYLRSNLTVVDSATESNNGGYADLASAWTDRSTLTYG